ncbi:sugar phosphate nucleotidyltransferase [Desmospora profundinema]|uniref:Mannose-1-phosphate guanylyltransferase/phosphomannomutase n=1 Tax=Desmospora profundinema TaxID=1571184 RepID=A0ABU1IJN7_9BACL|nr:sugar phosphate nucleotidyltransferase [Desmospora profundinema]MDR6224752.1 mannose-1-phosphate guanylyltransferase/phosphomannomutase [Desmospora profundinema]
MKAVIMAGGKGTRLRPLTNRLPKPMVPLLNKPCMEYIIELLKNHGITEIAVTVQYLPHVIREHFGDGEKWGVQLHYFDELQPLGTAGSVKNAEGFLDDTFLVISGDALTDVDLHKAIRFHREREAIGTLVLTRVEVPLEYGVVMTREDGRIIRFLEKPSWSEVFSDTVNTGIYVLEPEILSFFKRDQVFDFSRDLFPLVMEKEFPLFGVVTEGYWSDIGNLEQYRQAQWDLLEGRVEAILRGKEWAPGIRVEDGVYVEDPTSLSAPVFLGAGTRVDAGGRVGPYTVLGRYNRVRANASLERTVLWNRNEIAESAELAGTTLAHDIRFGPGARAENCTVVGENSWIGERVLLSAGVKVWPDKTIGPGTVLTESLIWEGQVSRGWFGQEGVSGVTNRDLTPERAGSLAAAFGRVLGEGTTVVVGRDGSPFADILHLSVTASLMAAGVRVVDAGVAPAPSIRHGCFSYEAKGGLYICCSDEERDRTVLQFFDGRGVPIPLAMERKVEQTLYQGDYARPSMVFGTLERDERVLERYRGALLEEVDGDRIRSRAFKVVLHTNNWHLFPLIQPLLERLGCRVVTVLGTNPPLERFILDNQADLGVHLDSSGQSVIWYSEAGRVLGREEQTLVETLLSLKRKGAVPIPVTAPREAGQMVQEAGMEPVHVPATVRALLEASDRERFPLYGDGCAATAFLLEHLAQTESALEPFLAGLPPVHLRSESIFCPAEAKGRVMRRLMEEWKGGSLELLDGIKMWEGESWVLIRPHGEQERVDVVVQEGSSTKAKRLLEDHKEKVLEYRER